MIDLFLKCAQEQDELSPMNKLLNKFFDMSESRPLCLCALKGKVLSSTLCGPGGNASSYRDSSGDGSTSRATEEGGEHDEVIGGL